MDHVRFSADKLNKAYSYKISRLYVISSKLRFTGENGNSPLRPYQAQHASVKLINPLKFIPSLTETTPGEMARNTTSRKITAPRSFDKQLLTVQLQPSGKMICKLSNSFSNCSAQPWFVSYSRRISNSQTG